MLDGSTESLPAYSDDDWQAVRTLRFLVKKNIRIMRGEGRHLVHIGSRTFAKNWRVAAKKVAAAPQ
jgi:hypothetical protein